MNKPYEIKYNTNLLFDAIPDTKLIKIIESSFEVLNLFEILFNAVNQSIQSWTKEYGKYIPGFYI
ncbi:MAG: hypothetical protein JXB88_22130 [Spirochaetales bacterium]|nr:hypothetical protein [Spirochaetales bacterium]